MFGGTGWDEHFDPDGNRAVAALSSHDLGYSSVQLTTLQIYHPRRDEWRVVSGFVAHLFGEVVFEVQGNLRTLSGRGISSFTFDARRSTLVQSISPELLGPAVDAVSIIDPIAAHAISDELLAIVNRYDIENMDGETCLVRCMGLGSQNKALI